MTVHVMLDLETWGTAPGSALRSIGAVTFSPYGLAMAAGADFREGSFYANIERSSCEAVGLKVDPKTVEWWIQQSPESAAALVADQKLIFDVIEEFSAWWRRHDATYVWSNGANFDEVLWRCACQAVGRDVPWKYWNVRDTRTIWHLARLNPKTIPRIGIAHDALADAKHQALCVTKAYEILGIKPAMAA
jgi:3' exoribonuclease, RNase T-like